MALSTLAEWTGSAIVSNLVDTAYSYLGERMLPADIEEELTRLKTALPKIITVMSVAEALKLKNPIPGLNEWLQQFKLAFLAAEDVLDELEYWELADKVKNQAQVSESSSSILASLKRKFPSSNISNGTIERLRKAVKMLDLATTEVGSFFQFATALHSQAQPCHEASNVSSRETTSFLTESKVVGREKERAKIIEWLEKPASHAHISAFCIVGAGGLGKTTLAQLIYEDMNRDNHFNKVIWVCVSTSFTVEDITRKILEDLGTKTDGSESLNGLQKSLMKKKKVLFFLDDVWNDNRMCDWEKLIAPMKFVTQGSKILVTTRMKSVAEMVARVLDVNQQFIDFKGLENQELLLLFNKYAFQGYNPNNYKGLQTIGKDIVRKLWGSPLAAKVIGTLLNTNMDLNYWKRILNCDSMLNLEDAKEVVDVLKLSYFHLPTDLQQCFRFCSIFPQDHKFEKGTLIRLWMASGFLGKQFCVDERPEDTGERYFNHLLMKSFFEPYPWEENSYVMHDLLHDLAQNVSQGECCRVESNEKSLTITIPSSTQHVSVNEYNIEKVFHLRNLRTLKITKSASSWSYFTFPIDSLKGTLHVLDMELNSCDVPKEICGLIHLRYLTISGGYKLPCSLINKLHHLQALEMDTEQYFDETDMTNLVSLRHMRLPECVMRNIKGLGMLTSLQELKFFVGKEKCQHIDELKTLNNLRELSIAEIENIGNPSEAKNAELSKKESLISLSLFWTKGSNCDNPEHIIDNLQPSPTLKNLKIEHYQGCRSPIWMNVVPPLDLSSFSIYECPLWEDLPLLAQMPNLRKLSLKFMSDVKELDYSFDSTRNNYCPFPSLEVLCCEEMPKWQSWAGSLSNYGFPNLRQLYIRNCPNLVELPALPLSLFYLIVQNVGLNSLPDIYDSSSATTAALSSLKSSLKIVVIRSCSNLTSLNGFLQQENLDLQALEKLHISDCKNLVQPPTSAFGRFESLIDLSILNSPKLLAVDNHQNVLPVKLQNLCLGNCGEFDVQLLESAAHLSTLHDLTIGNGSSISCIPSSGNVFPSLRKLYIEKCDKLIEYSWMEYARGVSPVNKMATLKIEELEISHLSLLFIEPLRSLTFVSKCRVQRCYGMETLPEQWLLQNSSTLEILDIYDARFLRALPSSMVRLTVLKELRIYKATSLEEILELPASLREKHIKASGR